MSELCKPTMGVDGADFAGRISEAGAMSSFIAAGLLMPTTGSTQFHFYLLFNVWFPKGRRFNPAAAYMRCRVLLGGTAGRTTLNGEDFNTKMVIAI